MIDVELAGILIRSGRLNPEAVRNAELLAKAFAKPLATILVEKNLLHKAELGQIIAGSYGVDYTDWSERTIPATLLRLIPEETAISKQLMPLVRRGKTLSVAMADPLDFETINFLQKRTGLRIHPSFSFPDDLNIGYVQYKQDLAGELTDLISDEIPASVSDENLLKIAKHIPVVQALDTILEYGIAYRASDLHFEGQEDAAILRFRIDGILRDMLTIPKSAQAALIARIKILANLKIDEHRLPQDGRFRFTALGLQIALRVSIIPSYFGENVVLRLLFESEKPKTLAELGLWPEQIEVVTHNIQKTHGMILVTGPTGSGKTTTLYSLLHLLNHPKVKLCTVEDPIEYGIPRITQIQVNPQTGLDFATGLRSLLRHDPDIMMVGEIRDGETATTAIQAALTGHLVLSTLHTNDAPSTIPRFLDLGSEGFLLASTLELVIAQRLVRRVCRHCRRRAHPPQDVLREVAKLANIPLSKLAKERFTEGAGCSHCQDSGYHGRLGMYELFEIDKEVELLIRQKAPVRKIQEAAVRQGMITMFADGVRKAVAGETTLEEVLRVSRE